MNTMWASALLVLGWAPMLVGLIGPHDLRRNPPPTVIASTDRLLLVITWALCIAITALALIDLRRSPDPVRCTAGVILFLASMAAWPWARAAQGAHFAQVARAPRDLVTRGPYAFVRHPMYVATTIGTLGQAVAAGTLRTWVVWGALALVFAVRAYREEILLRAAFGAAWDAYARHTVGFLRPSASRGQR